jgi:HK97 gp10 family phage protein
MSLKLEGFREASRQLNEMSRATARNVGKRSLRVPAEILASGMKARVSRRTGATAESIEIAKSRVRGGRPEVAVLALDIASVQLEFGNSNMTAEPFARPALDAEKTQMLDRFGDALKAEIEKAVIRATKRAAKG